MGCVVLPSSICVYHQKGNSIWLFMIWVFCNINMTKWLHSSQLQSQSPPPLIFSLVQAILFFSTVSNPVESFWRHYRLHDMSCYIEVWNMFLNTYSYYYTIKNINVIKHTSLKKIHAYNILLLLILLFGITALYMLPKAKVNFFQNDLQSSCSNAWYAVLKLISLETTATPCKRALELDWINKR